MADEIKTKKEPEAFLLRYRKDRLHTFNFPGKEIAGKFIDGGSYRFQAGINKVTREQWDLLKAHPLIDHLFEERWLEFIGGKSPDEKGATGADLADYSAGEAIGLTKLTGDLDLLNAWLAVEKRGGVAEAIRMQIDAVGPIKKAVNE